jgi:hypothetical protein
MTEEHDHPPTHLSSATLEADPALPAREILTPMGKSTFRSASLEEKGYRYSFAKGCDEKLVEVVYLKDDGTTGTVIADIDSLLHTEVVVKDDKPVCLVTFKLLKEVSNPVDLYRAEVPLNSVSGGIVGKMLRGLLDYFFGKVYGREKV